MYKVERQKYQEYKSQEPSFFEIRDSETENGYNLNN